MYDDWKELIATEMQRDLDDVMNEIESDPAMKNIEAPEEMYSNLMAMIDEYEKQEAYGQLSEEDKELIRLGKVYKKRRKWKRALVLVAAVVVVLGVGSVCMGADENIFKLVSSLFAGQDRTVVNSDDTEIVTYVEEEEVYVDIEKKYGFSPVKLEYLPSKTAFYEATFDEDLQGINIFYITNDEVKIIYIIRPNYRESSLGTIITDEKIQEYPMVVNDVEITITEYNIVESGENRWAISFEYQNVQYLLRITDMAQAEIEKIVKDLCFM